VLPERPLSSEAAKRSRRAGLVTNVAVAVVCFGLVVMAAARGDIATAWPLLALLGLNAVFFSALALSTLRSRVVDDARVVDGAILLHDGRSEVRLTPRDVKSVVATRKDPLALMWRNSVLVRKSDTYRAAVVALHDSGLLGTSYVCVGDGVPDLVSAAEAAGFRVLRG